MDMKTEKFFSETASRTKASAIRELLKYASDPTKIYLAGGLPDPKTYLRDVIEECAAEISRKSPEELFGNRGYDPLNYTETRGFPPLLEKLSEEVLPLQDVDLDPKTQLMTTTGGQQGLDLVCDVFLDKGDHCIVELPTYLGMLGAADRHNPNFDGVPLENDGMNLNQLENTLQENRETKFIYTVPEFQNPSGVTTSQTKREEILDLAEKYDTIIIEDSPYKELRYEGEDFDSFLSMGSERVLQISTFSKTFCPGLRTGFISSENKELIDKLVKYKQHNDLCSPAYTQALMARVLSRGNLFQENIEKLKKNYKPKRDLMLESLEEYMPEPVEWNRPEGGLFLSVRFPEISTNVNNNFTQKCIERGVVFVPGSPFYPPKFQEKYQNDIRVTFGYPSKEEIQKGIKILSEVTKDFLS